MTFSAFRRARRVVRRRAHDGWLVLGLLGALAVVSAPAAAAGGGAADDHVQLQLQSLKPTPWLVFGLPLPPGRVKQVDAVRVSMGGRIVGARVVETLAQYDGTGKRIGARAILVAIKGEQVNPSVEVSWSVPAPGSPANAPPETIPPFDDPARSWSSPEVVETRSRTLVARTKDGPVSLSEGPIVPRTLWTGREPNVLVRYPEGYLARTGFLGRQVTAAEARRGPNKGLRFLSVAAESFAAAAMYELPYKVSSSPDAVPDPKTNFESWLYDRCTTFLLVYSHTGEPRFLRHALRTCSWYARQIRQQGPSRGTFSGKPDVDPKYSHARGLFSYYALTGDEAARDAIRAIADYWLDDQVIVASYRQGRLKGTDKLWTERLLGTALEGLYYGYRLTGKATYFAGFTELLGTAYRHITGDARVLASINPGSTFPPQNCFVHSALQHGEGDAQHPWCSGWMVDLLLDPLLRYQEDSDDPRVDEIFIRLTRFLRDTGTAYFRNNPLDDTFLHPSTCDTPATDPDRRMLVPLYGAALDAGGKRVRNAEYSDYDHCVDATGLVAAGIRALRRRGLYDKGSVGPFPSEGESFLQLHQELAACAERTFLHAYRPKRAPSAWTPEELAPGRANPDKFVNDNKIGFPIYDTSPQRKLSWWFNSSLESWGLLSDAHVTIEQLRPGRVRGPSCK